MSTMRIDHQKEIQINEKNFKNVWLVFVHIKAKTGFRFNDLIDLESSEEENDQFKGAWANILVEAKSIKEAIEIVPLGLDELNFAVKFIDIIENIASLIENNEINNYVIDEAKWLSKSDFVF